MSCLFETIAAPDGIILCADQLPIKLLVSRIALDFRDGARTKTLEFPVVEPESEPQGVRFGVRDPRLEASIAFFFGEPLCLQSEIRNVSDAPLRLERFRVRLSPVRLGKGFVSGYAFFKNGHQSWTQTRSYRAHESERVPNVNMANVMQDNLRNLPTGRRGEFHSELFAMLGNPGEKAHLLIGQGPGFHQFFYIRARLHDPASLELEYDFGGKRLAPGQSLALDKVYFFGDNSPNLVQDAYFDQVKTALPLPEELPAGWCSWYYYYTKINQTGMLENLESAHDHKVSWRYFVLDDGYQTAVGDWLSINAKFPDGPRRVAERVSERGLTPGIWLAPFIARKSSRLYHEHPDWFLKTPEGKTAFAGWNPLWGLGGNYYGLDTTHPGFQEYLKTVIEVLVHEWGFRYLKLDFLYGATLTAEAHDPSLSAAERLQLGYDLVRRAAGPGVVLLGCGSPLGPAVGKVEAMRIGPDVAPFWFAPYRYHLTQDPHALCTKFGIRSILNRAALHRRFWINDPDCLMLRPTDTKLTAEERMALANAAIITGGMVVISDKLKALDDTTWDLMKRVEALGRRCDKGRCWALDIMEREFPEMLYNTQGYLAVFHFGDRAALREFPLSDYLCERLAPNAVLEDQWTGENLELKQGALTLSHMAPHSSRLFRIVNG